jgi:hypothetical protein
VGGGFGVTHFEGVLVPEFRFRRFNCESTTANRVLCLNLLAYE